MQISATIKKGLVELFGGLVTLIFGSTVLYKELGPSSYRGQNLSPDEEKAYDYFLYLSWKQELIAPTSVIDVIPGSLAYDVYLRSFNIFLKIKEHKLMVVVSPTFVSHLIWRKRFQESFGNILKFTCAEKWRVFEEAFPHGALVYEYFQEWSNDHNPFPWLIAPEQFPHGVKLQFWKNRGPKVVDGGKLNKRSILDIVQSRGQNQHHHHLSPDLMGYFYDKLELGTMLLTADMSASADFVVKIGAKEVIEFQVKKWGRKLTITLMDNEVQKSIVNKCPKAGYKSTFVFLCSGYAETYESENDNITVVIATKDNVTKFFGQTFLSELEKIP